MASYDKIMEEYNRRRERSSGKSVDELLEMTQGQNECQFLFDLEIAIQQKEERVGYENLSAEEQIVLAIEALEREVNNGGYSQFFLNSSGEYAPIIVDALTRIGCPEVAAVTRRAIETIRPAAWAPEAIEAAVASYAETESSRWAKIPGSILMERSPIDQRETHDAMSKALRQCDQAFYSGNENIGGRLIEFVKANKESIRS